MSVLKLIYEFGFSTKKVAAFFIDDKSRRVVRRLIEKKWVRAQNPCAKSPPFTEAFGYEDKILTLTEVGWVELCRGGCLDLRGPQYKPKITSFLQIRHKLEGQIVVKRLPTDYIDSYESEHRASSKNGLSSKRFDIDLRLKREKEPSLKVGVEIELSGKYDEELCQTRKRIFDSLSEEGSSDGKLYDYVFYFIDKHLIDRYQEAFSAGQKIYHWGQNSFGQQEKVEILEIAHCLAAKIFFFPILNAYEMGISK